MLQFEGEYLEGKKWNGKGYNINGNIDFEIKNGKGNIKKYNDISDIYFEGEYINGKINGKGKEYNCNYTLKFEGEYINGKRDGKGKGYYENGKLEFEGTFSKGEKKWKCKRIL